MKFGKYFEGIEWFCFIKSLTGLKVFNTGRDDMIGDCHTLLCFHEKHKCYGVPCLFYDIKLVMIQNNVTQCIVWTLNINSTAINQHISKLRN
jgi:hypothetical protein